jgi:hypothetical protein
MEGKTRLDKIGGTHVNRYYLFQINTEYSPAILIASSGGASSRLFFFQVYGYVYFHLNVEW